MNKLYVIMSSITLPFTFSRSKMASYSFNAYFLSVLFWMILIIPLLMYIIFNSRPMWGKNVA